MVTWQAFETESAELAAFGRERIDRRVSFLATIRADGGPRVHPVTPWIFDGHLYVRMFDTSPKVADLTRDPRYALHSMMDNDDGIGGEFALRGRAELVGRSGDRRGGLRGGRRLHRPAARAARVPDRRGRDHDLQRRRDRTPPLARRVDELTQATRPGEPSGAE